MEAAPDEGSSTNTTKKKNPPEEQSRETTASPIVNGLADGSNIGSEVEQLDKTVKSSENEGDGDVKSRKDDGIIGSKNSSAPAKCAAVKPEPMETEAPPGDKVGAGVENVDAIGNVKMNSQNDDEDSQSDDGTIVADDAIENNIEEETAMDCDKNVEEIADKSSRDSVGQKSDKSDSNVQEVVQNKNTDSEKRQKSDMPIKDSDSKDNVPANKKKVKDMPKQKTAQRAKKSVAPSQTAKKSFPSSNHANSDVMTINLAPIANVKLKLPNVEDSVGIKRTSGKNVDIEGKLTDVNASIVDASDESFASTSYTDLNDSAELKDKMSPRKISAIRKKRRRRLGTYKLPQVHKKPNPSKKKGVKHGAKEKNNNCKGDDDVGNLAEGVKDMKEEVVGGNSKKKKKKNVLAGPVLEPKKIKTVSEVLMERRQENELKRLATPGANGPEELGPTRAKRARLDRSKLMPIPKKKGDLMYQVQLNPTQVSPKIINVVQQPDIPMVGEPVKLQAMVPTSLNQKLLFTPMTKGNNVRFNSTANVQKVMLVPAQPISSSQVSLLNKTILSGSPMPKSSALIIHGNDGKPSSPMVLTAGATNCPQSFILTPVSQPPTITPQKPIVSHKAYKMISTSSPLHVTSPSQIKRALGAARSPITLKQPSLPSQTEPSTAQVPNGVVTPPRSPCTADKIGAATPSDKKPDVPLEMDLIPLCACKLLGRSFNHLTHITYCQALDSMDGKVIGCCNKVSNGQLVRPAVKIPFMAVCEVHRKRLKMHQCCPGCGHFCSQGKFYQCKKEGGNIIHHFHKQCQVFKDGKFYCPHCGEDSEQFEVNLQMNQPRQKSSFFIKDDETKPVKSSAKMTAVSRRPSRGAEKDEKQEATDGPSFKIDSSDKVLSTEGLPFGPSWTQLKSILSLLETDFRPKKLRFIQKNLFPYSRMGDLEKVVYMLAEGFDPNFKYEDHNNQTALHIAAAGGHLSVVHCLIQAGGDPNAQDNDLVMPLMRAAEKNHVDCMDLLVKAGSLVDARGDDGMTCIHLAAREGHMPALKYILSTEKVSINVLDEGGWTPLIWSAEYRRIKIVKYLLEMGADPNIKDNEENIALHWAAFSGSADIAEIFLNAGCDLESANEHGDRPLHIATRQDHYECVVLFLARGADCEGQNNENEAPIACCTDKNSPVWMALKVNRQLKSFAAKRLERPEKLIHRDLSFGKEKNPIPCVNGCDEEKIPKDYLYVMENIETSPMNINRVITSLQSCACEDDCSSCHCICGRSSVRCWYDKEGHLIKEFNQMEPPLLFECNHNCRCWMTCNNRVVQNGIICRLQLFRTRGRGWGVRTLLDIPQGTFICEYIGEIISDSEADRREDDSYLFDLDNKDGETYCIDARRYGNVARFINHLCEPNIIPVKVFVDHQDLRFPRICFFSSREIKAGEELGFDYGEKFWIIKWKQFTCACGSPKCKYSQEVIHKTLAEYHARMEEEQAYEQQLLALS